jgi:hypothetical protein
VLFVEKIAVGEGQFAIARKLQRSTPQKRVVPGALRAQPQRPALNAQRRKKKGTKSQVRKLQAKLQRNKRPKNGFKAPDAQPVNLVADN